MLTHFELANERQKFLGSRDTFSIETYVQLINFKDYREVGMRQVQSLITIYLLLFWPH